jgi:hypothetical protein
MLMKCLIEDSRGDAESQMLFRVEDGSLLGYNTMQSGRSLLVNFGKLLSDYMTLQPRRLLS